jgi:hypothetical protein
LTALTALSLVCSLKPSPAPSSSQLMSEHVLKELSAHGVTGEVVRCVDHDIKAGVEKDMGDGDQWPAPRDKILSADILIIATPTWMGHMSWPSACSSVSTPKSPRPTGTGARRRPPRQPPATQLIWPAR